MLYTHHMNTEELLEELQSHKDYIEGLRFRLRHMENMLSLKQDAFTEGYVMAMKDNGLLLDDIELDDISDIYLAEIRSKLLTNDETVDKTEMRTLERI